MSLLALMTSLLAIAFRTEPAAVQPVREQSFLFTSLRSSVVGWRRPARKTFYGIASAWIVWLHVVVATGWNGEVVQA